MNRGHAIRLRDAVAARLAVFRRAGESWDAAVRRLLGLPQNPRGRIVSTMYDVWWCPEHGEWTVPSRPHQPECPSCGKGGWWRRFTTGAPYQFERGGP